MAALDLQEQEQLEGLKAWWKDNGNWVLGVVLFAVIAVGGWRGWHYYQAKQANEAATFYEQFNEQLATNDAKRINDAATVVMDKYAGTIYAARAALAAAQVNEQSKAIPQAKTQLQWVLDHAAEATLKDVAHLRMASILLDEKNYADALKQLDVTHPAAFDGLYADLKGDVLSAQGKKDEARLAYQQAFDKIDARSTYRQLIQMKLDDLGAGK
ncbi:MAG: tetratricopeptide repeat protein [Gallionella sp.]|jgi:predicted negative regulator of RcsB-dependent stress response|nr:tetratricopeptide repeat protein [Gallionella sp.]